MAFRSYFTPARLVKCTRVTLLRRGYDFIVSACALEWTSMTFNTRMAWSAAIVSVISTTLAAQGQEPADEDSIEEIIVTTTRRPTRIADTANRIEVIDQEELE